MKDTPQLRKEYDQLFASCTIKPEHEAEANAIVDKIVSSRSRYEKVAKPTGVPWHVVGIIHKNRNHQTISYDFAAAHQAYESHSAIVVEVGTDAAGMYAMTVGGNESNSVGRKRVALDSHGFVEQQSVNPYVCVIENRKG